MLGAILYNRAAIRVFNARISEVCGIADLLDESKVDLEAASAANYSLYVKDVGMRWTFDLLVGQIHLLRGEASIALEKLESQHAKELSQSWRRLSSFAAQI